MSADVSLSLPPGLTAYLSSAWQHTLQQSFVCTGIGLHSGQSAQVRVLPAEPDQGRYFCRLDFDREDSPIIPARLQSVRQTLLSTELVSGEVGVRTVEHLLAALAGLGIDNARIEIDGAEVPLLDGSAQEWVAAIGQSGWQQQPSLRPRWQLQHPVSVQQEDSFAIALPAVNTRFSYGIEFSNHPVIGRQWCSFTLEEFAQEIAPARTFGFAEQVEQLRARGLIKGGTLENALVCGAEGWLNPPLRFADEPVRHKLLDLIGDLSLLGTLPPAHYLVYKGSHALHSQLASQIEGVRKPIPI